MNSRHWVMTLLLACSPVMVSADDDMHELWSWFKSFESYKGVKVVSLDSYQEECGSCHFAYQPGLLPKRSWKKVLSPAELEEHFGENAELDNETLQPLQDYVLNNAADGAYYKRSKKIMASLGGDEAPLRITDVRYIKQKHAEIPQSFVKQNEKVRSLSYCDKCHTKADKGSFDDDDVYIPGYGRWND